MVIGSAYSTEKCRTVSFKTSYLVVRPHRFAQQRRQVLAQFLIVLSQSLLIFMLIGRDQFTVDLERGVTDLDEFPEKKKPRYCKISLRLLNYDPSPAPRARVFPDLNVTKMH